MVEFIGSILVSIFGSQSWIATLIISMFPIIELKGAIPIGMSVDFWGEHALNGTQAFFWSLLGSCLVVPILALVFTPILKWLKTTKLFKKIAGYIEKVIKKYSSEIKEKAGSKRKNSKIFLKCLFLFLFVCDPIPLTGVWTGTCVGVMMGLKLWQIVLSVVLGNVVAGLVVTFVCSIFPAFTTIIMFIIFGIILAVVIYSLVKYLIYSKKSKTKPVEIKDIENIESK